MHPTWLRWAVLLGAGFLLIPGLGISVVHGIAADNLSNAGFVRDDVWHPDDVGIPNVPIRVAYASGHLIGYYIPGDTDVAVILVHGHGHPKASAAERWAPFLHQAGHHVIAYDLPNHGQSVDTGAVTYGVLESGTVGLFEDIARGLPGVEHVIIMGGSMGAMTSLLAGKAGIGDAIIADSAFASLREQAIFDGKKQGYPVWLIEAVLARMSTIAGVDLRLADGMHAVDTLHARRVPLMLAHCTDDTRIDVHHFDLLAPRGPATIWRDACPTGLSPHRHVDGWAQPGYNATVLDFIERARDRPEPTT